MSRLLEDENMNQPDAQPSANYVTFGTYEAMFLAAENGDPEAQRSIGLCFETGAGVAQDFQEAVKWFRKAAEQGNSDAQLRLGFAYEFGKGVTKNLSEALKWYRQSAEPWLYQAKAQEMIKANEAKKNRDELTQKTSKPQTPQEPPTRMAISSEVRREVWRRDERKCVKCGSQVKLEFDHIIPFSEGGSNTARNIQLLCQDCNRAKSASIQ
jgi:HNH endonuclease/Sel1 repeat-containing protein